MTAESFDRALRSFSHRRPFQSYWIEFQTCDTIFVVHPEAAQIRGNLVIYIATDGRQRLFDSTSVCQLLEKKHEPTIPSPA